MNKKLLVILVAVAVSAAAVVVLLGSLAYAEHSWGGYHWARQSNPFTLKLGDNVSSGWEAYLAGASFDWSLSSVLDTTVVSGSTKPQSCKPKNGQVEVCNAKYGRTGWVGIAQIWVSGGHITQAIAKMNDTYFNTSFYNTPAWRRFVMCQEIGHTFGLAHQNEDFNNPNMGSCMDYTGDPDGTVNGQISNEHPNLHDYEWLETIYASLDEFTTITAPIFSGNNGADVNLDDPSAWGKSLRKDSKGHDSLFERNLGKGQKVFTFVIWAE